MGWHVSEAFFFRVFELAAHVFHVAFLFQAQAAEKIRVKDAVGNIELFAEKILFVFIEAFHKFAVGLAVFAKPADFGEGGKTIIGIKRQFGMALNRFRPQRGLHADNVFRFDNPVQDGVKTIGLFKRRSHIRIIHIKIFAIRYDGLLALVDPLNRFFVKRIAAVPMITDHGSVRRRHAVIVENSLDVSLSKTVAKEIFCIRLQVFKSIRPQFLHFRLTFGHVFKWVNRTSSKPR